MESQKHLRALTATHEKRIQQARELKLPAALEHTAWMLENRAARFERQARVARKLARDLREEARDMRG